MRAVDEVALEIRPGELPLVLIYVCELEAHSRSCPPESSCCIEAIIVFRSTLPKNRPVFEREGGWSRHELCPARMASQSADTGGDRNQDHPLHSPVPSVRGKANRHHSTQTYFNSHRSHNSREGGTPDTSVSRPVANLRSFRWRPHCRALYQTPGGCLISQRFALAAVSGRPLQKPRMKSSNVRISLQRVSRLRLFHCRRINSPETGKMQGRGP